MWIIALLMFFSLLVAGAFLAAFVWAVRHGQYDDKYTPAVRILFDESPAGKETGKVSEAGKKESPTE